ncbi:MAG: FUSC family protein [Acidobacteriota bacterium]|nr:FUSC family protein [Acidobacteriota bacterium]
MDSKQPSSPSGIKYALRILAGTSIVWFTLRQFHDVNPLWAVVAVVVVSEPQFQGAVTAFKTRMLNTVVGCVVALAFLELFGLSSWSILLAMAASVLAGAYMISAHVVWRIAPVTVGIIMIPGFTEGSHNFALDAALWRTGETLYGCAVAVGVAWVISETSSRWCGQAANQARPD